MKLSIFYSQRENRRFLFVVAEYFYTFDSFIRINYGSKSESDYIVLVKNASVQICVYIRNKMEKNRSQKRFSHKIILRLLLHYNILNVLYEGLKKILFPLVRYL